MGTFTTMQPLKVLYIGNSYTYYHNLPSMVTQLAASSKRVPGIETAMVAHGYKTLEWHTHNPKTIEGLRRTAWDIVVLQEFSMRPIENREAMYHFASLLHDEIRKTGGHTVLYLTWARRHTPEMQQDITAAYTELARILDADVAPVGTAWQNALAADCGIQLYKNDQSHPTPLGSYLAACVFYATFFKHSPVGLTGTISDGDRELLTLPDHDARHLQSIAWDAVEQFSRS